VEPGFLDKEGRFVASMVTFLVLVLGGLGELGLDLDFDVLNSLFANILGPGMAILKILVLFPFLDGSEEFGWRGRISVSMWTSVAVVSVFDLCIASGFVFFLGLMVVFVAVVVEDSGRD